MFSSDAFYQAMQNYAALLPTMLSFNHQGDILFGKEAMDAMIPVLGLVNSFEALDPYLCYSWLCGPDDIADIEKKKADLIEILAGPAEQEAAGPAVVAAAAGAAAGPAKGGGRGGRGRGRGA